MDDGHPLPIICTRTEEPATVTNPETMAEEEPTYAPSEYTATLLGRHPQATREGEP